MPLTTTLAGGSALIKWLLRDEFTDTRAAGAVNGTPATPGPGTRVVATDTGNNLSIGGGELVGIGSGANADPQMHYGAIIARVAGKLIVSRVQSTAAAATNFTIGFNDAPAALARQATFQSSAAGWRASTNDVAGPIIAIYANGVYQGMSVILRTTGAYFFIQEIGGSWALVWVSSVGNATPLYPLVGYRALDADVDYVRIPDALYLPTPLAYDTFTRANGALGSTETTGPDGQTTPAHTWNNRVGTTQIATNKASASALVGGIAIATVDTGTADVVSQTTLTRAGDEVGIVVRYVDADNYVRAIHDGTNCKLIKRVAAAETDVISVVVGIGAGEIVVTCEGTSFSLYLNNAQRGVTSTIGDAVLQTGTEQGLFSTNVGNTQNDLLVMPRGTNGEYSVLERYSS